MHVQVQPETVATDSFMVNLQAILLRFCEPFMDANYTKVRFLPLRRSSRAVGAGAEAGPTSQIDRIDPLYYARSDRLDLKEETRINATSGEAEEWWKESQAPGGTPSFSIVASQVRTHVCAGWWWWWWWCGQPRRRTSSPRSSTSRSR